jgi:hypothetical protein
MQLDLGRSDYLHTGVDLFACDGDMVCTPILASDSALVAASGEDSLTVLLTPIRPSIRQEGKTVGCFLLHVAPLVVEMDTVVYLEQIGVVAGNLGHMHEEIHLGSDYGEHLWDDQTLVNPLTHANEGALWGDAVPPLIDSVRVDSVSMPTEWVWRVYARDGFTPVEHRDNNNAVYRLELEVNGQSADGFDFDRFEGAEGLPDWSEFYCAIDTGRVCYRLVWERGSWGSPNSWCVRVWDAEGADDHREFPDTSCLGQCHAPSWGCIKNCYWDGAGGGGAQPGADRTAFPGAAGARSVTADLTQRITIRDNVVGSLALPPDARSRLRGPTHLAPTGARV